MANHMKEVANMLGVDIGERFQVFDSVGRECPWKFYFTEKDLVIDGANTGAEADMLRLLICGIYTVKNIPWKPSNRSNYYYIDEYGCVDVSWWDGDVYDLNFYKLGNCYPTPQEAEANKDKWITFYTSDEVLWR